MRPVAAEVLSIQRMICTGCGAEANASCNCGVSYIPKAVRAREAVAANPEKSNGPHQPPPPSPSSPLNWHPTTQNRRRYHRRQMICKFLSI